MIAEIYHVSVMLKEVVEMLDPKADGTYIDATIGTGGHTEAILKMLGSGGRLIGIDRDDKALEIAEKRLGNKRVIFKKGNFSDMESLLSQDNISEVDGILFDLGLSMVQLKSPERGFSFMSNDRLDMRMDRNYAISAWDIVNKYPEKELERIFKEFGEERLSRKIAKAIIRYRSKRQINTCSELSNIIEEVYGGRGRYHPATRTFQALRIEVNKELDHLRSGLDTSLRLLKRGGRLCVISYHSLEDRMVKNFIAVNSKKGLLKALTKKPMIPCLEEIKLNPSSRSAKLRGAEKI
ncbi:MAG: 16S rRNA (cytosine(1402)-N(4))-methyltransferase RsmH [Nitrospirota bacterium]